MIDKLIEKCEREFTAAHYPIVRSNEAHHVRNKAAIWTALTTVGNLSDGRVAKYFNYDRTTILHHRNKHMDNMKYLKGYDKAFTMATSIVRRILLSPVIDREVARIEAQIRLLEQTKSSLINQLEK